MLKHLLFLQDPLTYHLLLVTSPGSPARSNPSPLWAPRTSTLWALTSLYPPHSSRTKWHTQAARCHVCCTSSLQVASISPGLVQNPELVMIPADRGISVLQVRRLNVKHTTGNTGKSRHTQGLHTGSHRWTTLTKDFKKSFIKILSYQVEVGGFSRVILHTQISVWRHSVSQWERFPEGPPAKDQYILWRL